MVKASLNFEVNCDISFLFWYDGFGMLIYMLCVEGGQRGRKGFTFYNLKEMI